MTKQIFETPEAFVRAYMEAYKNGDPMEDFAKRFGSTRVSMQAKVGKFRQMGVKLPSLPLKRGIDVKKLNALIQELMPANARPESIDDSETFNAECADCHKPFYTKSGAMYCVNCIKRHPGERSQAEANRAERTLPPPSRPMAASSAIDPKKKGSGLAGWPHQPHHVRAAHAETSPLLNKGREETPTHPCKNCGHQTTKLFCSEECRKEYEKAFQPTATAEQAPRGRYRARTLDTCKVCQRHGRPCKRHGGAPASTHFVTDCLLCGQPTSNREAICTECKREEREKEKQRKKDAVVAAKAIRQKALDDAATLLEQQDALFTNPYDCQMCLNAQALCTFHEKMAKAGKLPIKYRPYAAA